MTARVSIRGLAQALGRYSTGNVGGLARALGRYSTSNVGGLAQALGRYSTSTAAPGNTKGRTSEEVRPFALSNESSGLSSGLRCCRTETLQD